MNKKGDLLSAEEFVRLVNNFYNLNNIPVDYNRMAIDSELANYITQHREDLNKKFKVALCCICLNPPYWQFARPMVDGARQFFLPGHDVDVLLWSDIKDDEDTLNLVKQQIISTNVGKIQDQKELERQADEAIQTLKNDIQFLKNNERVEIYPIEPIEWPMPTLLRYHTFLQQEEKLNEYDFVFYCDIDMRFVGVVGDEVLGNGLTAAQHPMYAFDKKFWPPYEPNEKSEAFIKRPGRVVLDENGKPRFMPLYFAGGFQGGRTKEWIEAMKEMRKMIDKDFQINYMAIWNDESHWNRYLFDNPPEVLLTPSYVYPDTLIEEYYVKIWGCNYVPKLVTLTKQFSTSIKDGQEVSKTLNQLKGL